jgi:hypothetical protein
LHLSKCLSWDEAHQAQLAVLLWMWLPQALSCWLALLLVQQAIGHALTTRPINSNKLLTAE